jgi:hypothetical protein
MPAIDPGRLQCDRISHAMAVAKVISRCFRCIAYPLPAQIPSTIVRSPPTQISDIREEGVVLIFRSRASRASAVTGMMVGVFTLVATSPAVAEDPYASGYVTSDETGYQLDITGSADVDSAYSADAMVAVDGESVADVSVGEDNETGFGFGTAEKDSTTAGAETYSASALPGGSFPEYYKSAAGSTVYHDGYYRGVVEDYNRGTRQEARVWIREPGGDPDQERGVYGRADWYATKERCYPTSFNSASCSTSWTHVDDTETGRENSSTYQYWYMWDEVQPTYISGRGAFKGCIDIKYKWDQCTATVLRGSAY